MRYLRLTLLARQVLFVRNWSWSSCNSHFKASSCRSQQHPIVGKVRNLDEENPQPKMMLKIKRSGSQWWIKRKTNLVLTDIWNFFLYFGSSWLPQLQPQLLRLAGKNLSNLRNRIGPYGVFVYNYLRMREFKRFFGFAKLRYSASFKR